MAGKFDIEHPSGHGPRTYRDFGNSERFKTFRVKVETSDLYIKALCSLEKETERFIRKYRADIEWAIEQKKSGSAPSRIDDTRNVC